MFYRRVNIRELTIQLREDLHQAHIEAAVEIGEGIARIVRGESFVAPTVPVSNVKPSKRLLFWPSRRL